MAAETDPAPELWTYRAALSRVIDGDTFHFLIDHGMNIHSIQSVRLIGYDAPELNRGTAAERRTGIAARQLAVNWFAEHRHHTESPWPFYISTAKDRRSFNRYLAAVLCTRNHDLTTYLHANLNP